MEFTKQETEILTRALYALQNAIFSDKNGNAIISKPEFHFDIYLLSKDRNVYEARALLQRLMDKIEPVKGEW